MTRSAFALALLAGAFGWHGIVDNAQARDTHGRLSVAASVTSFCDIGGSPSLKLARGLLDFGDHRLVDAASSLGDTSLSQPVKGSMLLLCNISSSFPEVSFGYGLHATGKQRNLQGPHGTLIPYDLLRGGSPDQGLWDDNAYPVPIVQGTVGDIPVYGYIPALPPNAEDGLYTDTVTVQVDF